MIGAIYTESIGDLITFQVSNDSILTFQNFTRTNSVRFAKHDVLLRKPVSQFVGPDLDIIDLTIQLRRDLGSDPQTEFNKLIRIQRSGKPVSILTGTSLHGMSKWVIKNMPMRWGLVNNRGECISCNVNLSFEEYI